LSGWIIYHTLGAALTLGQAVATRTKLGILALLAGMFDLIWIGAAIALVYFLYGALANDSPWAYLSWPFAIGFSAWHIAAALKDTRQRIDYVDQLADRGYSQGDAEAAWRIATGGGTNLLRILQQAELRDEIDQLESVVGKAGSENSGD
jgi:hypothetical protein